MTDYYNQKVEIIFNQFSSSIQGLKSKEALKLSSTWGKNVLPSKGRDSIVKIFFRQFKSPLIYILLAACLAVFVLGEITDGLVILFVLIFNSIVGTIQEGKAQKTFLALRRFSKTKAVVLRDTEEVIIPDEKIVPGDVVVLREGEKVPADGRIIDANNLTIDESELTGESFPVIKQAAIIKKINLRPSEQKNMLFKGTVVTGGSGLLLVTAIGENTEIGKIAREIQVIDSEMPLNKSLKSLSKIVAFASLGLILALLFLNLFLGNSVRETFLVGIALAVSIIPEGLPVVLTLVLALGIKRMSEINVLVKKMQAVEALGQTRIIAVDKTGTITKNELSVKEFYSNTETFLVDGRGYEAEGKISYQEKEIEPLNHEKLILAGKISVFCSNAHRIFYKKEKRYKIYGDPTEAAMSVFAEKIGFQKEALQKEMPRVLELPFDYKKRMHVCLNRNKNGSFISAVGAPENILKLTKNYFNDGVVAKLNDKQKKEFLKKFHALSQGGFRVVALAYFETKDQLNNLEKLDKLIFLGFVGIRDELREGVAKTVEKFRQAGLKTIMITGDFEITAREIAKEAAIYKDGDKILVGDQLKKMTVPALAKVIDKVSVFARVSPQDKLKIIQAFKENKTKIAMTGDGVNDALSLVAADLGISMGKIGTEVAKEASDIVLLDDKFENMLEAFEEGRHIYDSIKRVVLFLISTGLGEVLAIFGSILLGFPIILTAVQIIWLNLVTDGFLDVALAMEPKRKINWRSLKEFEYKFWDKIMTVRTVFMAIVMAIVTIFIFNKFWSMDIVKAMTMSLTALAVLQWFNVWNCRHQSKSIFFSGILKNKFLVLGTLVVVILQIMILQVPFFQKIFKTTSLNIKEWILILGLSLSIIAVEEVRKAFYRLNKKVKY